MDTSAASDVASRRLSLRVMVVIRVEIYCRLSFHGGGSGDGLPDLSTAMCVRPACFYVMLWCYCTMAVMGAG